MLARRGGRALYSAAMRARLRALAREPLVHFAILGGVLFGIDAWRSGLAGGEGAGCPQAGLAIDDGPIVVDEGVRAELVERWRQAHGGPPSDAELRELVARWVDDEVLYREGLRRGLAENDAEVHGRVASQMAFVLRSRIVLPEPGDEELRAWLAEHPERFGEPDRVDFTQVFVAQGPDAQARADELLGLLEGGADPGGLGDTFSGGRRFRGRRIEALAEQFGPDFAAGVARQAEGAWALHRSTHGLHLVRIDSRTAARAPDFAEVKGAVAHDLREARLDEAFARAVAELRAGWEIVEPS